ncbi:10467_t:CDS:2, partial [Acaulospora colombiana]
MGIGRKAQPFERLTRRYRQFLTRLSSHQDSELIHQQVNENPQRTVLGVRSSSTSSYSAPMNIFHQRNPPQNPNGLAPPSIPTSNQRSGADVNSEKLVIFCDPDGEIGNAALASERIEAWGDFGTELGNKKENVKEAEPWKGVTLIQNRKFRAPMTEKIEVYHDQPAEQKVPSSVVTTSTSTKPFPITERTDVSSTATIFPSNSNEKTCPQSENTVPSKSATKETPSP